MDINSQKGAGEEVGGIGVKFESLKFPLHATSWGTSGGKISVELVDDNDALIAHFEDRRVCQIVVDAMNRRYDGLTNTEVLMYVLGWQGGTLHQLAETLGIKDDVILDANADKMRELIALAQMIRNQRGRCV